MKYKRIKDFTGVDVKSQTYMTAYLRRHYPVKRIKNRETRRFQRGIVINNSLNNRRMNFYLSSHNESKELFSALYLILSGVFGFKSTEITHVIYTYIYL